MYSYTPRSQCTQVPLNPCLCFSPLLKKEFLPLWIPIKHLIAITVVLHLFFLSFFWPTVSFQPQEQYSIIIYSCPKHLSLLSSAWSLFCLQCPDISVNSWPQDQWIFWHYISLYFFSSTPNGNVFSVPCVDFSPCSLNFSDVSKIIPLHICHL